MQSIKSGIKLQFGFLTNSGANSYSASEVLRILNFPDLKTSPIININQEDNIETEVTSISKSILFILCINGQGQIKIDKKEYLLNPYSICLLLPNKKFLLYQKSQELLIVFLHVTLSKDLLNSFYSEVKGIKRFNSIPYFSIKEEEAVDILEFGSFIIKSYMKTEHPYHTEMTKKMLYALIYTIQDLFIKNKSDVDLLTENDDIFIRFRKLIIQYYPIRNPLFYAEKLSYSVPHLSKIIKEISGKSISGLLDELVLQEAKSLLKETNTTIASISQKLRFQNSNSFSFFFKKRTGISPREYRNTQKTS